MERIDSRINPNSPQFKQNHEAVTARCERIQGRKALIVANYATVKGRTL